MYVLYIIHSAVQNNKPNTSLHTLALPHTTAMSQSWIFSLFTPSVEDRLRECRTTVSRNRRKLEQQQKNERTKALRAEQLMRQAEAAGKVNQAREYALQVMQAQAAEVQVIQTIGRLEELERSLATSESVVQMEQVMTDMTQALVQLNNVTPPQRMQHNMMHLERQHQMLGMKRDLMHEATESMRESDAEVGSAAGDAQDVDALRIARDAVAAPFDSTSTSSCSSGGGGGDSSVEAMSELDRLSRLAAAEQSARDHEASLDPASRMVLEAARQREARKARLALPKTPAKRAVTNTMSSLPPIP